MARQLAVLKAAIGWATAVLVCGVWLPAAAQDQEGSADSRISRDQAKANNDKARRAMKDVARCVYRREPDLSEKFLANSDPEGINHEGFGVNSDDFVEKMKLDSCLGTIMHDLQNTMTLHIRPISLRSYLAEESYLKSVEEPLRMTEEDNEVLANRFFRATASSAARYRAAFADCVVFNSPDLSDALMRTRITTDAETKAVQALVPALSKCLLDGQETELTVQTIRALVAEGLWARIEYGGKASLR